MTLALEVFAVTVGAGAILLAVAIYVLYRGWRARRRGQLLWADVGERSPALHSDRYRLSGRPDQVRRLSDGRPIPVEVKSRAPPIGGVPRSHRIQLGAYCLLLEETFGVSPPYGILCYAGGTEIRVPYDADLRAEVLAVRDEVARPYDGAATPSPARCRRCPWRPGCDRALA